MQWGKALVPQVATSSLHGAKSPIVCLIVLFY